MIEIRILPATTKRVQLNTCDSVNRKISEQTAQRIKELKDADSETIAKRLEQLDYEWDIERMLETNAAVAVLLGSYLGFKGCKAWFLLPGLVGVFLLQHALQGWCPPVCLFRKMGIRTAEEINNEKIELQKLSGELVDSPLKDEMF